MKSVVFLFLLTNWAMISLSYSMDLQLDEGRVQFDHQSGVPVYDTSIHKKIESIGHDEKDPTILAIVAPVSTFRYRIKFRNSDEAHTFLEFVESTKGTLFFDSGITVNAYNQVTFEDSGSKVYSTESILELMKERKLGEMAAMHLRGASIAEQPKATPGWRTSIGNAWNAWLNSMASQAMVGYPL